MSRGVVAAYAFAGGLATYGLLELAAARLGNQLRRRRDLHQGPLPAVIPITNRRKHGHQGQ